MSEVARGVGGGRKIGMHEGSVLPWCPEAKKSVVSQSDVIVLWLESLVA
jgi:hypothetical protein